MAIPTEVGDSKIDSLVTLDGCRLCTGDGKHLSFKQLREVVDVYNAWRVGNLQDCTITRAKTLTGLMEMS